MNGSEVSLMDVIWRGGSIAKFHWLLLILLTGAGILLGIVAILKSTEFKEGKFPLVLKMMICCVVATILAGMSGTLFDYVGTLAILAGSSGAAKAQMLRLSLKMAREIFHFSLLSAAVQSILLAASVISIQKKSEPISDLDLLPIPYFGKFSPLIFAVYLNLLLLLGFACFSIWSIEVIITLKPEDHSPSVFGIDFRLISFAGIMCACVQLLLLPASLIKTFARK